MAKNSRAGKSLGNPEMEWIVPRWPVPAHVRACTTLRSGGVSIAPYNGLNLAKHVGDEPDSVQANRSTLKQHLGLPSEPCWLTQVHGKRMVNAESAASLAEADGSYIHADQGKASRAVCAVLTADCLPVLLSDSTGTRIAAVHAGWRGLAGGVIESAINALNCPAAELLAWFGPAIGADRFEVGDEVRQQFVQNNPDAKAAFRPAGTGYWLADIYALGRLRLAALGVNRIYGGGLCTYTDAEQFYSYRRDNITGRMASLIWLDI